MGLIMHVSDEECDVVCHVVELPAVPYIAPREVLSDDATSSCEYDSSVRQGGRKRKVWRKTVPRSALFALHPADDTFGSTSYDPFWLDSPLTKSARRRRDRGDANSSIMTSPSSGGGRRGGRGECLEEEDSDSSVQYSDHFASALLP